ELKIYQDMGLQDWKQWDDAAQEPFSSVTKYANYGIRLQEELEIIEHSELMLGVDYDFYGGWFAEEHYLNNLLETNLYFRNTAPYLMAAYTIGETISLTPSIGARYNFSDYFEDVVGYQAGLKGVMAAINLTLYANYSQGYNLPGVYSAILFGGGPGGNSWQDLDAEQINHFEAGLTHAVTKTLRYHIAYFHDQVTSALSVVLPPPPPARYENIGEYAAKGINAEVQIVPIDKLDVFVGGTWTQTDPEDSPYAPEWTVTVGLNYNLSGLVKFGVIMQMTADYYAGNPRSPQPNQLMEKYNLVNMRVSCPLAKIMAAKLKGEIFIAVENMLNTSYELKPDYPMPGTTVMIGTDIKI
ncbi:TonB-dependent receptor, partial [bacterium]|nr:TonB-dependent receptor [bacterium]